MREFKEEFHTENTEVTERKARLYHEEREEGIKKRIRKKKNRRSQIIRV